MNHNVWEDGFFKIDPECHIIGDMSTVDHFPGVQMWWRSIDGIIVQAIVSCYFPLQKGLRFTAALLI